VYTRSSRRAKTSLAFAFAFLLADPSFDAACRKISAVSAYLMLQLENGSTYMTV